MASDVGEVEAGPVGRVGTPEPVRRAVHPHRRRFLLIYGGLAAILAAAVAGIVVFAGRSIHPAPAWSSWKPGGGGIAAARQIAAHVSPRYLLPGRKQLAGVLATPPLVAPDGKTTLGIRLIVVRLKGKADDVVSASTTDTVMFTLCCIPSGQPSVERGALLRREILELALYTFRYVGGIKNVIAVPPPETQTPRTAVYLRRSDVEEALRKPLAATLGAKVPLPSTIVLRPREVSAIRNMVLPRLYNATPTPTLQGPALLLTALPAS